LVRVTGCATSKADVNRWRKKKETVQLSPECWSSVMVWSFIVFINMPSLVKNMAFLVKVDNDIFSKCTIFKYKRKARGIEDQIAGRIEERAKLC
jgi:hypothetical protein